MVLTETPDYSDRILKYNCNFSGQGRQQQHFAFHLVLH